MRARTSRPRSLDRGLAALPRAAALLAAGLALTAAGCGHPATREECEIIFQRTVEIELKGQHTTDPKQIAEKTAATRERLGEGLIDRCVGRRITDEAVACVRTANTADEVDRCLR